MLLPRQTIYLDALGSWSSLGGPLGQVEAGVKLGAHLGLFAFGSWSPAESRAGTGVRVTF